MITIKEYYYPPLFDETLMIRVTHQRQRRYFPVLMNHQKIHLKEKEFARLTSKKVPKALKDIRFALDKQLSHFSTVAGQLSPFDLDVFTRRIKPDSGNLFNRWEEYAKLCEAEGRQATAESHRFSASKFQEFNANLSFENLTSDTLKRFQVHGKDWSMSTVAICLRNLRTIVNQERETNPTLPYPFDKKSFKIKEGDGKRGDALSVSQLKEFIKGEAPEGLQYAKNVFLFMLFGQGMNHEDLARLKYSDLKGDTIKFYRQKTINTNKRQKAISVPVDDFMRSVIVKYGTRDKKGYIFPIIDKDNPRLSAKNHLTLLNKHLKKYCKHIGLDTGDKGLSTYWCRHTFASLSLEAGVGSEVIKQALGHANIDMTETYLSSLSDEKFRDAQTKIKALL